MATYILAALLAAGLLVALRGALRHFRGQGGCCGLGEEPPPKKRLDGPPTGTRIVYIEGMRCEACAGRVAFLLDGIEGAAARVELARKRAILSLTRPVADEEIRAALSESGYTVTRIVSEGIRA